ncbi:hypothetical protein HAZT_HAZT010196 [Hyalella azteca]|uniref:Lysosomal Pro-X carboxypeptidase n=1 Tax=Hyalella azteca TaxID=294128 RepID=A0A6A0GRS3_HYAAZ|nr:hypothetical protein HAZT_HAZT010196 [Hyalella azteca]
MLDHFSYGVQQLTFMQKYLVNIDHWNRTGGPIFFYAGNEGSIELFALNTHKQYYQYQSSMQALADYVELLAHVRQTYEGAEKSPVIVFGGSYGGMLAAWMRIKYPHVVQGAIAASAPVAQFTGLTPCEKFGQVVTHTFALQGQECVQTIRKSWDAINKMAATAEGRAWLSDAWRLCKPLNSTDDAKNLKSYLSDAVCQPMKFLKDEPKEILLEIFEGLSVYFNYSTTATCLSYESSMPSSLDDNGWFLQSCTEMVMPMCYDGKNDFFEPQAWNLTEFSETCVKKWDVRPEPYKMEQMYGGRNLKYASNIVFSNGLLDPWSSGGVLEDVNESVVSVIIPEGAHHLDLRSSERADPKSVIQARDVHKANILKWISEYSNSV